MGDPPRGTIGANDVQNQSVAAAVPSNPFVLSDNDEKNQQPTFDAVIKSSRRERVLTLVISKKENEEPIRHLIGTALPWDGLSEEQPYYLNIEPGLPVGRYQLTIADVPDDASWSITAYSKNGSPEPGDSSMYNVNSVTAVPNVDRSVTVHFGACGDDHMNCLPITDGWGYVVRLCKAHRNVPNEAEFLPLSKP